MEDQNQNYQAPKHAMPAQDTAAPQQPQQPQQQPQQQPVAQPMPVQEHPQRAASPNQPQYVQYPQQTTSSGKTTGALICAILAIVFCGIPIVGIILGIVALVLASKATKEGDTSGKKTAAKVCGGIGIGLSVIAFVLYMVLLSTGLSLLKNATESYEELTGEDITTSEEKYLESATDDELAAMAVVEDALEDVKNKDSEYIQKIADALDESFAASAGYELSELGVDATEIAEWFVNGTDYSVDSATLLVDDTGWVNITATTYNTYAWTSAFSDEVSALANDDTYVDIAGSEEDVYAKIGEILISTMNDTTDTTTTYLIVDVTKENGEWVIDQSSLEEELEYLYAV